MPQTQPKPTLMEAVQMTIDIYGLAETERALAEDHGLTPEQITYIMRRLNASQN